MKKIAIMLLAAAVLFGFAACDENPNDTTPEGVAIANEADLRAFAAGTGKYADADVAYLDADLALVETEGTEGNKTFETITFANGGVTLNGNGHKITFTDIYNEAEGNVSILFAIADDDVSFTDVDIEVSEGVKNTGEKQNNTRAIVVNPGIKNFIFTGSSIKGVMTGEFTSDAPTTHNVVIGIAFSADSDGTVENSTIDGCAAAINVSTAKITLKNVGFEGHVYFDSTANATDTKIEGLYSTFERESKRCGHVDFANAAANVEDSVIKTFIPGNEVKFYKNGTEVTVQG